MLERNDLVQEASFSSGVPTEIEDLFAVNDLTDKEEQGYTALRSIYPDFVPIVKIARNPQS